MSHGYTRGVPVDTDPNLAADSDFLVPSQKAVKSYVDTQIAGVGGGGGETTTTLTGNQIALAHSGNAVLRCNNASLLTIQGIVAGTAGQRLTIVSVGAGQVDLSHLNGSAAAADRLTNLATVGATSLAAGRGSATLVYDATSATWRLVEHDQGAWLTPAFAAGDYTASGAMTWTVGAGDITSFTYFLRGKTLTVNFWITSTTIGGTLNISLIAKIPGGYQAQNLALSPCWVNPDNTSNTNNTISFMYVAGGAATTINIQRNANFANWPAATDRADVRGCITFEVV